MGTYIASRVSDGNKLFPCKIVIDALGVTVHIPGFFRGEEKTIPFSRIASVQIQTPLVGYSVQIYNKYESHRKITGFVLPMLTNQKVNSALKSIADIVGIQKRLSFHASRHTYATTALELGVDIASISSLMGHRTIKTTQIYAKMTRNRKVEVVKFLNERNKKKILVDIEFSGKL
ncbi:MAG TPA: site-specific integrase [Chitinophagales bacterium]|nr:site-specific integrase [Chitinophagales bacterium]